MSTKGISAGEARAQLLARVRELQERLRGRMAQPGEYIEVCAMCEQPMGVGGQPRLTNTDIAAIKLERTLIGDELRLLEAGAGQEGADRETSRLRRELAATRRELAEAKRRVAELEAAAERRG